MSYTQDHEAGVLRDLVAKAIDVRADRLEVEYKDGYEEVFAFTGMMGVGIAQFKSNSNEATSLREELHEIKKKRKGVVIGNGSIKLKVDTYQSFGEDVFRVKIEMT